MWLGYKRLACSSKLNPKKCEAKGRTTPANSQTEFQEEHPDEALSVDMPPAEPNHAPQAMPVPTTSLLSDLLYNLKTFSQFYYITILFCFFF